MKKIVIGSKMYDAVSMNEFTEMKDAFSPKFTAIEGPEGTGLVLPIRSNTDIGPGVYYNASNMVARIEKPENMEEYSSEKIVDYSHPKNIDEIIDNDKLVRNMENEILTTKENIFQLNIGNDDTKEMIAMKKAINSKQVDIKQYESRFDQFQNDLRLLKGSKITLGKLISTCNYFDIDAVLTLKDKKGDIANPMNTEITISLTDGGEYDESGEDDS